MKKAASNPPVVAPATPILATSPPADTTGRGTSGGGAPPAAPTTPISEAPRHLIWSDEFKGPAGGSPDSTNWSFDTGGDGWGNNELESYTSRPGNASARRKRRPGHHRPRRKIHGLRRDHEAVHVRPPADPQHIPVPIRAGGSTHPGAIGAGTASRPSGCWATKRTKARKPGPDCGEIDAMEVLGSEPNVVNGTLHGPWPFAPDGVGGTDESPYAAVGRFSRVRCGMGAGTDQLPAGWVGVQDDHAVRTYQPGAPWPLQHPFFLLLNLAVGGEWPGSPDASTEFPARMVVNWVRVWQ